MKLYFFVPTIIYQFSILKNGNKSLTPLHMTAGKSIIPHQLSQATKNCSYTLCLPACPNIVYNIINLCMPCTISHAIWANDILKS